MKIFGIIFLILALAAFTGGLYGAEHQYGVSIACLIISYLAFDGWEKNKSNSRRK